MKVDVTAIREYVSKGLLTECVHHAMADVSIFNYTKECQYSQAWDEVTLMCRGLIVRTSDGEVIARSYNKFFNYEELIEKNLPVVGIEGEVPFVMEKYDGSLGILYFMGNDPMIATRGSFKSEQAQFATAWIQKNCPNLRPKEGYTHVFEIIYPENRIVVDYEGWEGLVYLGTIEINTGTMVIDMLPFRDSPVGMPMFEINPVDVKEMKARNKKNEEGYVVYYPVSNIRYKIKFDDYVKLHRIMTGLNEITVWEAVRDKEHEQLRSTIPEEMLGWYDNIVETLFVNSASIIADVELEVERAHKLSTRAEQAELIKQCKHPSVAFLLLDGKVDQAFAVTMKMIRPHGNKTYKVDIDK
jgi:RNA ligase